MGSLTQCNKSSSSSNNELLEAQTSLWTHIFSYIDSMSLKCAVELGIPDAIHNHGGPISLPDLLSSLSISSTKKSQFQRLMRTLTHSGIFNSEEELYSLNPISTLLVNNSDKHVSLSQFVLLELHQIVLNPFQSMAEWFKNDASTRTPFGMEHGYELFEKTARDPEFSKLFNSAMMSDSMFLMSFLLQDCAHVFEGVTSLVDVGGGIGATAISVSKAFPGIRCSVLELPAVVSAVSDRGGVDFVCGDMFDYVPRAHAVMLKWILHDWNDEDCVKILKRCKEAIPCREQGGKVIIIDMVMDYDGSNEKSSDQAQIYRDMMMMVVCGGAERVEEYLC